MAASARAAEPRFRSVTRRPAPPLPSRSSQDLLVETRRRAAGRMVIAVSSPPWRRGLVPSIHPRFLEPVLAASLSPATAASLLAPAPRRTAYKRLEGQAWSPGDDIGRNATVGILLDAFSTDVIPAAVTAGTRASYYGPWLAFLVFAVANRCERDVMPASADLVRAFMDFLVAADLA
eukprot:1111863-Rhodomonas_salina.1